MLRLRQVTLDSVPNNPEDQGCRSHRQCLLSLMTQPRYCFEYGGINHLKITDFGENAAVTVYYDTSDNGTVAAIGRILRHPVPTL